MCLSCRGISPSSCSDGMDRRNFLAAGTTAVAGLLFSKAASAQDKSAASAAGSARIQTKAVAFFEAKGKFKPHQFTRRPVGDDDLLIEILYSGVCHSDVHKVRDDWKKEAYPIVPGHEMAGRVVRIGRNVTKFKVGDYAGVGCWIGSCGQCEFCRTQMEHLCAKRVLSFASVDHTHDNEPTNGGYSNNYVVPQSFAIKIAQNAEIARVAPLLCAGITSYTPLVFSKVKRGDKVGVAGFGGLGHMAVKYAVALGAEVTVFDITENKRETAKILGATRYVNVSQPSDLEGLNNSLNVIINTIPAGHDVLMYVKMLRIGGEMAIVGLPPTTETPSIPTSSFPMHPLVKVYGSNTGSISQIQEMMDYSVANGIYPDVEVIPISAIDDAFQSVLDGKVKFRYVIDMKTLT